MTHSPLRKQLFGSCISAALLYNEFFKGRLLGDSFPHELAVVWDPANTYGLSKHARSNAHQAHLTWVWYSKQTNSYQRDWLLENAMKCNACNTFTAKFALMHSSNHFIPGKGCGCHHMQLHPLLQLSICLRWVRCRVYLIC